MMDKRFLFHVEHVFRIPNRRGPILAGRLISKGELSIGDRLRWTLAEGSIEELAVIGIELLPRATAGELNIVVTGRSAESLVSGILLEKVEPTLGE